MHVTHASAGGRPKCWVLTTRHLGGVAECLATLSYTRQISPTRAGYLPIHSEDIREDFTPNLRWRGLSCQRHYNCHIKQHLSLFTSMSLEIFLT
jgi:hypothetical protein